MRVKLSGRHFDVLRMMKSGLIYGVSTVGVISYFTVFSLNEK